MGCKSDVVDGYNGFVAEQREKPGECVLTLVQLDSDDPYEVIHDAVLSPSGRSPTDLTPQQYRPRGMTPLRHSGGPSSRLRGAGRFSR